MKQTALVLATVLALAASSGCKRYLERAAEAGAAAASASAEPKEALPVGTKFTKKPPAVGMKRSEDTRTDMKLKLKMLGKDLKLDENDVQKKDEEVLEVTNGAITKMKVTYTQDDKTQTEEPKPPKTKASVLNGKTFILTLKDGKVAVLNDKEKPASKAESAAVEKDYHAFGKPDPFTAAIPDRALKDGEELPELGDAIKNEILSNQKGGKDDKMVIDSAKVVFKGKDGDNGVFDVSMNMKADAAFMKMSMPFTGKMALRVADAAPASLTMDAPINLDLTDKDKASGVDGSGTIKLASTFTYK